MNVRTTLKVVTIGIGTVVMANAAANVAMRTMAKTGGSVVSAGYMTLAAMAKLATPAPVTYHRLAQGLEPDWMQLGTYLDEVERAKGQLGGASTDELMQQMRGTQ